MSYDVAVWEGDPPGGDAAALQTYRALWARHEDTDAIPSPRVLDFVDELTATHPDLDDLADEETDESPWADGPLRGNAMGPFVYLALIPSKADATIPFLAKIARRHGLVCFDPQTERLISTTGRPHSGTESPAPLHGVATARRPHALGAAVGGIASGILTYWTGSSWERAVLTGAAVGVCLLVLFAARARFPPHR